MTQMLPMMVLFSAFLRSVCKRWALSQRNDGVG